MALDLAAALRFAAARRQGTLVTYRADGRAQLSNVLYAADGRGTVRVSVTADRAKTANLRRDPRAALHVSREDFFAYVVLDGTVELTPVAARPDDPTVEALVDLYRTLQGEHEDWDAYRAAMVADRRLVATLTPTSAYGMPGE